MEFKLFLSVLHPFPPAPWTSGLGWLPSLSEPVPLPGQALSHPCLCVLTHLSRLTQHGHPSLRCSQVFTGYDGNKSLWHQVPGQTEAGKHFSLLCLEKLVSPVSGRLAANEHRNMELENTPKASCLANGDILHVSGACLRSLGTGSLLC